MSGVRSASAGSPSAGLPRPRPADHPKPASQQSPARAGSPDGHPREGRSGHGCIVTGGDRAIPQTSPTSRRTPPGGPAPLGARPPAPMLPTRRVPPGREGEPMSTTSVRLPAIPSVAFPIGCGGLPLGALPKPATSASGARSSQSSHWVRRYTSSPIRLRSRPRWPPATGAHGPHSGGRPASSWTWSTMRCDARRVQDFDLEVDAGDGGFFPMPMLDAGQDHGATGTITVARAGSSGRSTSQASLQQDGLTQPSMALHLTPGCVSRASRLGAVPDLQGDRERYKDAARRVAGRPATAGQRRPSDGLDRSSIRRSAATAARSPGSGCRCLIPMTDA